MKSIAFLFLVCVAAGVNAQGGVQGGGAGNTGSYSGGLLGTGLSTRSRGGLFGRGLFTPSGNFMAASGAMGEGFREYGMCGLFLPNSPQTCLFMFLGGGGLFN